MEKTMMEVGASALLTTATIVSFSMNQPTFHFFATKDVQQLLKQLSLANITHTHARTHTHTGMFIVVLIFTRISCFIESRNR